MNGDRTASRLNLLEGARMNYRMLRHLNNHSSTSVQTTKAEKLETTKLKFNPELKGKSSSSNCRDIYLSKADDFTDEKSTLISASNTFQNISSKIVSKPLGHRDPVCISINSTIPISESIDEDIIDSKLPKSNELHPYNSMEITSKESTNKEKNHDNQKVDSNQSTNHRSNLFRLQHNISDEEINKIWKDSFYKNYHKLEEVGYVEPRENMKQKDHHHRPPQNISEEDIDEIWKDLLARKIDDGAEVMELGRSSDSMEIEGGNSIVLKNSVEKHIVINKSKIVVSSKESTECLSETSYDDDSTIFSYSKSDEKCIHLTDSNDSHETSSTQSHIDSRTSSHSSID